MDFGKLSETLRGVASHAEHYAATAVGVEEHLLTISNMIASVLHGLAGALEASPVTIPGPVIVPPVK